jgi:hypothetical protein
MTNRISGDFDYEVMEAFRAAYAQQLASPDDDTIANDSGLPTSTIANTSPWISSTGMWKYPSGKGPDDDLKQPFDPNGYFSNEVLDGDGEIDEMSDEEVEHLVNEITGEGGGE